VVEVAIEESLTKQFVCMQTAILHTTCNGERRIRVMTLSLPTTTNLADVYASADQTAITTFFSHKAVERTLNSGLEAARDALQAKLIELLQTYRKELAGGNMGGGGLQFPANLRGLPVLFLGLMKHVSLSLSVMPVDNIVLTQSTRLLFANRRRYLVISALPLFAYYQHCPYLF
jgi:protein transport protein SEC24